MSDASSLPPQSKTLTGQEQVNALPDWVKLQNLVATFLPKVRTVIEVSAATYTVNVTNNDGSLLDVTSNVATTITLADDLPVGTTVDILARGSGVVTVAMESGVPSVPTGKVASIAGQYQVITAAKPAAGVVVLLGALADA